ncbi:MAG: UDP-N-acetylmuramoyl-tripeptide--D-alanyl-D-alanine ligase [Deltaproteobacteria bacterium]|nr:UDP-N-acetylmuramoyl-tripeptide--D-alanyl-D-alanine ligase [Deltaproteobacteria bacterium]
MKLTLTEIITATQGVLLQGNENQVVESLSTDSRTIQNGEAFLCLKGESFDGHDYIEEVIQKGASLIIFEKNRFQNFSSHPSLSFLEVQNSLESLGNIARSWRRKFSIPLVAIGGSNGKTTTKDMSAAVLSAEYVTLATEGNLNNLIGVPKMLLKLKASHQAAVIEMGMNDFGEMKRLTEIAEPTVGLLTNTGFEHMEKMKDLEGVARSNAELFQSMPSGTLALINQDDAYISKMTTKAFKISFGISNPSDVYCVAHQNSPDGIQLEVKYLGKTYSFESSAIGPANVKNALAAIAVGFGLGLDAKKIQKGLKTFQARSMRMEQLRTKSYLILNDCYNANPSSMEIALQTLQQLKAGAPGLAVLGEMKELGDFVLEGHRQVGKSVAQHHIHYLIVVGPYANEVKAAAQEAGLPSNQIFAASSQEEIFETLQIWAPLAKTILVKGSRGARMERVTEFLMRSC